MALCVFLTFFSYARENALGGNANTVEFTPKSNQNNNNSNKKEEVCRKIGKIKHSNAQQW